MLVSDFTNRPRTNTYSSLNIFGPLVNDITLGVGLDETAGRSTHGTTHVSDEETTIGLGADLISNGAKKGPVAVRELGEVRVTGVPVKSSVLSLQQRQQTTTY